MGDVEQARDVHMSRVQNDAHYLMLSTATMPLQETNPIPYSETKVRSIFGRRKRKASSPANDTEESETDSVSEGNRSRHICATDFGATYTSVSILTVDGNGNAGPDLITISNYPDDPRTARGQPSLQVPSEIWYGVDTPKEQPSVELNLKSYDALFETSSDSDEDQVSKNAWYKSKLRDINKKQTTSIWGFGVQNKLTPEMDRTKVNRISRLKLLLDRSEVTKSEREDLLNTTERLQLCNLIPEDENVIARFLTHLFLHAKQQSRDVHRIPASARIEHALSVPILWDAYSRLLFQNAIQIAIEASGFGTMDNLFFVSEPEGALTYVLSSSSDCRPGDKILNLDIGGITADAGIFQVKHDFPLRLSDEPLVTPEGPLHGSSFLNSDFREHLEERLQDDIKIVEANRRTFDGVLDKCTWVFETEIKRNVNVYDRQLAPQYVEVDGIKENHPIYDIFAPRLLGITEIIRRQLTAAKQEGHIVKKVVMTGGFSTSISIRTHVQKVLERITDEFGYTVELMNGGSNTVIPDYMSCGVARRAYQKDGGPSRISDLSYGFEVMEEFGPEKYEAHKGIQTFEDRTYGCKYVPNVLNWLIPKKGDQLDEHTEYPTTVYRIFNAKKKILKFVETLYVSDTCTESHYSKYHEKNRGKVQVAGEIAVDMTSLVTSNKLERITEKNAGALDHDSHEDCKGSMVIGPERDFGLLEQRLVELFQRQLEHGGGPEATRIDMT
ncbi:hypothetical protein V502_00033 [Pseudogymnoascus sp. VKM F-4520 (FW-2644)]|nr:hypothetical protein V502_00033 [Pseudogymnoascus sp. VKM F-4520 (FW-2644)]